ncbi:phage tail tape measure protein [Desulfurobacterium crinifex]
MASNLELAIGLSLFADNFLRAIAETSRKTNEFKSIVESIGKVSSFEESVKKVKKLVKETNEAKSGFEKLRNTIKKTFDPKNLDSFGEKLESLTVKLGTIGGAITLGLKSVVTDATEFEKGLAEASTLVKTDFEKFKKLYSSQLLEISVSLGQEKSAVTKAFYDAISSGFDPKKALEIIKVAGKSAVAGVSDISTANNTLITVMKAWGLNLKEASDYIFKTVAKGRTTFTEIARNIGGVAAIISSAGVKFKEFSAIVATATAKGLDTAQTMTSIREIVNALISPTTQAEKAFQKLGITVNKETLKQKGLVGTLKEITDAMKQAGLTEAEQAKMLSEIFGSVEAQKVVNMFIADPESFVNTLKEFQQVGGETDEAFKKMSESTWFAFNRLSQAIASTKIAFGSFLLPAVNLLASGLTKLSLSIKSLISEHSTLAKVVGIGIGGFGLILTSIAGVAAVTAVASKTLSLFIEGLELTRKAGKKLYEILRIEQLINTIQYRGGFLNFLQFELLKTKYKLLDLKATAVTALSTVKNAIVETAKAQILWAKTNLLSISGLKNLALTLKTNLFTSLKTVLAGIRALTVATLTNPLFWIWIGAALAGTALLIYKFWKPIKHFFEGFFKGLADSFSFLSPVFSGVAKGISLIGSILKPVGNLISSILKLVDDGGKATKEWGFAVGHLVGEILKLPLTPIFAVVESFKLLGKAISFVKEGWSKLNELMSIPVFDIFSGLMKFFLNFSPFGIIYKEWQSVFNFLKSINLFKTGERLISTFVEGIKSKAGGLINAVKGTLSKVRNLLPFSPAKEGPLSDLHKTGLRFVETIAEGIKEDSLIAKVSSIMKKVEDFFWTPVQIRTSVQPLKLLHKAPDISLPSLTLPEIKPLSIFQPIRFLLSRLPEVKLPPLIQTLTPLFQPARLPEINFPPLVQTVKLALEKLPKLSLTPLFQPVKFILSRLPEVNLPPLIFPALLTTGLAQPSFPVPYQKPLSISHISTHNSPAIHHHNEIHIHITVNGKANREDAIEIAKIVRAEVEKLQREQLRKEMRIGYGVGTHYTS